MSLAPTNEESAWMGKKTFVRKKNILQVGVALGGPHEAFFSLSWVTKNTTRNFHVILSFFPPKHAPLQNPNSPQSSMDPPQPLACYTPFPCMGIDIVPLGGMLTLADLCISPPLLCNNMQKRTTQWYFFCIHGHIVLPCTQSCKKTASTRQNASNPHP